MLLFPLYFQVDENDENVSWKAIGYCGPDPDFKRNSSKRIKNNNQENTDYCKEELLGPLYKGIISLDQPRNFIFDKLQREGFSFSVPKKMKKKNSKSNIINPSLIIKCDVVVVGSGSGGGVIAGILANSGYKVLVLEKGNYFARNNLTLLEGKTMDQMYLGNGLLATDNMDVIMLAGSTVGGGSTINWSASIKTPNHVIKEWSEKFDLELFDSKLYNEAMDIVCQKMGVQCDVENEGFNNMVLRKGCEELGYPVTNIPRNSSADHYCGWCCLGCKDGKKKGTTETWLKDLVDSGNGAILPNCTGMKVLKNKSRKKGIRRDGASGVLFRFRSCSNNVNERGEEEEEEEDQEQFYIAESKVVVVACGAIGTPELLKTSGLKNPNIGKYLHIHPVAMGWGYFPDHSSISSSNHNQNQNIWPEPEKKSYQGGIMTAMSSVVANSQGSGYGALIQTPSLHPGMFSALMPWLSGTQS